MNYPLCFSSACPLPKGLDQDIRIISAQLGMDRCSAQVKGLAEWVQYKKLERECVSQRENKVAMNENCKYIKLPDA